MAKRAQINPEVHARIKAPKRFTIVDKGEEAPKRLRGGQTLYHQCFLEMVYKLSLLACSDEDLARIFEVERGTLQDWYKTKDGFADAVQAGRDIADANVAHSLYKRAIGYSHPDVKIFYDKDTGNVVEVPFTRRYPPDTTAAALWLRNRRKGDWFQAPPPPNGDELPPPTIVYSPVTVRVQNVTPDPPKPSMVTIDVD
jgi:hypothetical protein